METFDNIRKILRGERPDFSTVEEAVTEIPKASARPAHTFYVLVVAILATCGLTVWWYSGDCLKAEVAARRGPNTLNIHVSEDPYTQGSGRMAETPGAAGCRTGP